MRTRFRSLLPCVPLLALLGCRAEAPPRFALRPPLVKDTDERPVYVACRERPTDKDPHHVTCAPEPYVSPLYWDGADNLAFRPLAESLAVTTWAESVDVNSLDEVPDSAWFTNRIGVRPVGPDELRMGGCKDEQILRPEAAADGSWVIDQGKMEGSSPGFRMKVPGQGKYLVKAEDIDDRPEGQTAASVIGIAVFHAAGYNTPCEQIIYVRPSVFRLVPGLRSKRNFDVEKAFDRRTVDHIFARAAHRNGLVRLSASAWLPGYTIGPYPYEGTRKDDPNDVIPHEDRRELRGERVLAAWLARFDAREENTLDTWISDGEKDPPDSSPGHVVHYQLDTSETFGAGYVWDEITRRLGHSYVIDWGDLVTDYVSLGAKRRPWDTEVKRGIFGYFDVAHFEPQAWKPAYPNPAFSRMTERDAAWMARILARFTPRHVAELARMAEFTSPRDTAYLERTLDGRLERILRRYLLRLSPIAAVRFEGADVLCGTDLAAWRRLAPASAFRFEAWTSRGERLPVELSGSARVCVRLRHADVPPAVPATAADRYVRVTLRDGAAKGPLDAYVYDLGPSRGFALAGVERPDPGEGAP
ncbi:MAG TPA: hypothetical protein VHB21_12855 [Minicystis sp.]|nr:hypothetical protein [Minicystis sp.]